MTPLNRIQKLEERVTALELQLEEQSERQRPVVLHGSGVACNPPTRKFEPSDSSGTVYPKDEVGISNPYFL